MKRSAEYEKPLESSEQMVASSKFKIQNASERDKSQTRNNVTVHRRPESNSGNVKSATKKVENKEKPRYFVQRTDSIIIKSEE